MTRPRLLTLALAPALALAALLGASAPAAAVPTEPASDPAACAGASRTDGGYRLIEVPERFVPPPLRGSGWDCAGQIADRGFVDGESNAYVLYWVGVDADAALDILARFEDAGWTSGDEGTVARNSAGRRENARMGVDELRAWDPLPGAVDVRFGDGNTGRDIIEYRYGDGVLAAPDPGLAGPVLMIDVITSGGYDATGAADPSVLSGLRSLAEAMPSSTQAAVLGGTAVFLTLLVAFPGYLLDSVLDRRWSRLKAWWRARRPAALPHLDRGPGPSWLVWPGFAAASLIACFVEPSFGANALSVRLYLTVFASLALINVVGWAAAAAVMRRLDPASRPRMVFRWGSLGLVAVAVLVGRLLAFEPGAVFGIVAGLTFAVALTAARDALVVLVGAGTALALAGVAWAGYSLLAPVADAAANPALRAIVEALSAVVVEGVSTMPLALLPLLALDGAIVFAWRRGVWTLAYLVGVAAFVLVMLTVPEAWAEVRGDYLHWLLVFGGFAALAVGAWATDLALERRRARRAAAASGTTASGTAGTGPVS